MKRLSREGIEVSVVMCTCNRAESLRRALESIADMAIDQQVTWEIVIVDNGSTDATAQVVESFADRLPIRRVYEGVPGIASARNRGADEARGRYIVWTDDDVKVDRNWLASYLQAFRRWPEVAIFGGAAQPVLEQPEVPWFKARKHLLRDLLALRDYGAEPVEMSLNTGNVPFGLNYAVRADVHGHFRYNMSLGGMGANRRINGEEVEFYRRVLNEGFHGLCLPGPIVYHQIPLSRQTEVYVRNYYESAGETWLVLRPGHKRMMTRRANIWAKFIIARTAYTVARVLHSSLRYDFLVRDAFHTGVFRQLRQPRYDIVVEGVLD